jgi:hypothetical protein
VHRRLRFTAVHATAAFIAGAALAAAAATPARAADRLAVVAVGTPGGPPLTSAATAVSLLQVTAGQTGYASFTTLPASASATNVPVTLSGTNIDEGHLTVAPDGSLLLAGYDAVPGTPDVAQTSSASVPRVVAKIGATGTVTTATRLGDAFSGGPVTSVATDDGQRLWLSGGGPGGSLVSSTLGATTATPIQTAVPSASAVSILPGAGGAMFLQPATGADDTNLYQVGSGLPTSGAQPTTTLYTSGNRSEMSGQAVLLDLDGTPGIDTAYVSVEAHLYKLRYKAATGTWLNTGSLGGTGLNGRALAVSISGGVAHIYAAYRSDVVEQDDSTPNSDDLTYGPQNFVAGAPPGMEFRGIALLPADATPAPKLSFGYTGLANAVGDPTQVPLPVSVTDPLTAAGPFTFTSYAVGDFGPDTSVLAANAFSVATDDPTHFRLTLQPHGVGNEQVYLTATTPDGRSVTDTFGYGVSAATDATSRYLAGGTDASTAIDVGGGYTLIGDDEVQTINLFPTDRSSRPVNSWDFTALKGAGLAAVNKSKERDIEAAARAGNRIYWAGSHGLDKDAKAAPERNTLYATDMTGSGASTQLSYVGQYNNLQADLAAWDHANGHGLGADYLGLTGSIHTGVNPKASDGSGLSIEGLEFAAGSTSTAYVAFRAPLEPASNRHLALVVPVTNIDKLVQGNPQTAVHAAFGAPLLWNLGGLGIREIRANAAGQYLIVAGPPDETPAFALYVWDGNPAHAPVKARDLAGGTDGSAWEGVVTLPSPLTPGASVRLVGDRGDAFIYGGDTAGKDIGGTLATSRTDTFALDSLPLAAGDAGGTVPATLALTLGAPASFGAFAPGVAQDYTASTTANVISTAGDATLSVADPSATATGHLVNGAFALPSALQARAASAVGAGGAAANVGGAASPTPLLTYAGPASNDAVTVSFTQHVGATDALRTGTYAKTLTFTLSTTTP